MRSIASRLAPSLALAVLGPSLGAQQLVRSVAGPAANARYGKACIRVPDQDADGVADLLVGAPGFNGSRGAIYCVSGAYLATGSGSATLWSLAPSVAAGDQFGFALDDVGDVTNDGVHDFLVGQPGYDGPFASDVGAVRLVDGVTHAIVSIIEDDTPSIAFGSSIAACGDRTGDGIREVAVGAPGPSPFFTQVFVIEGWSLRYSQPIAGARLTSTWINGSGFAFGASLASGFDLDGDGFQDIAVGAPGQDGPSATDAGECRVLSLEFGIDVSGNPVWSLDTIASYVSTVAGERLGESVDAEHDYDGDGVVDILAGAPYSPGATHGSAPGRALVLSGAALLNGTSPAVLRTITISSLANPTTHTGAAVRASEDLNGDGVGDILVGAPDFRPSFPVGAPVRGAVTVLSGATGDRFDFISGADDDRLGDSLLGALEDLDGDGLAEFVIAGSTSDSAGTDSGVVKCYRLFPVAPSTYCAGKVNSLGCTPSMSWSGVASAGSTAPFLATCSNVISQTNGLCFYSHRPAGIPFQGGTMCAEPPVRRTPLQSSGGTAGGGDCTGVYGFDFNDWIQNGGDASLVAGAETYCQYWARDPQSASTTSLSNALRFVINP